MNWRHAPPDAPTPTRSLRGSPSCCCWSWPPRAAAASSPFDPLTTTFSRDIDELTQHLLHDYSVSMPSNLEPDGWCAELWRVHFLAVELGHMRGVAGTALRPLVAKVAQQVGFVEECGITDPTGCVGQERSNVSRMLRALNGHMAALKSKMAGQDPVDFSNCTPVPLPARSPGVAACAERAPAARLLQPEAAGDPGVQGRLPAPEPSAVLLLLVPILGSLAFVSLWQHQRRLRGQLLLPSLPPGDPGIRAVGHLNEPGAGADRKEMAQGPPEPRLVPLLWILGRGRPGLGPLEPDSASYTPLLRAKRRVESATPPGGLQS
ncbi:unnamed protein product [Eretmochelys imbricata]